MTTIPEVHIGVDISKNNLDIHIFPLQTARRITNTKADITKFIKQLRKYNVAQIACEATGGYEKMLAELLKKHGYNLWIIDPRRIRGFIIATGCKSKTDKIDAQKIAKFSSQNTRDYIVIEKTGKQSKIHALVNRKNDLTKFLGAEKARLKHPSHELYISSIQNIIVTLSSEIKAIEKQIKILIKSDSTLTTKAMLLESIPGIGAASAALLLSHLPELGEISNRKISALVGLCPYDNESGRYKGKKRIRGGRVSPRNNLYMCALTTIKYNLILKGFYDRLIAAQKPFKVAIVAVMHKLIILANAILKKGEICRI